MKWISRIIGVFCILYAIQLADFRELHGMLFSSIIFLVGLKSLFMDCESDNLRKVSKYSGRISLILAVFLVFKVLVIG